ncbi:MAG TPA: gliding motility protein GldM, partial [Phaeodactylibacter sp.]|nr:gliding motility protein GldM [Phaeodactylibacter sp.]
MSIPKEPRQLMINLMYLVLTALLALNVSAEVMNAFFSLDKGIKESGKIVDTSNTRLLKAIQKQAKAYP